MSDQVSPTTAIAPTAAISVRSAQASSMSGLGRPRPASAGETLTSKRSFQPSSSMSASRVAGEKPVVRATLHPRPRSRSTVSRAPGTSRTPTSWAASVKLRSNASFASAPRSSNSAVNTSIFDWPMVSMTYASIFAAASPSAPSSTIVRRNASRTSPPSSMVVPAMSKHTSSIGQFMRTSPLRSPVRASYRDRRLRSLPQHPVRSRSGSTTLHL